MLVALLLLLVSWLAASVASAGLLVGFEVRGVMDRGPWVLHSFERGGRSSDYVPASLRFFLLVALRFCACFCPCFASVGLRGGRADSLLCFWLATLRGGGLSSLACFAASVASLGSGFIRAGLRVSCGLRFAAACSRSPAAALLWLLSCRWRGRSPVFVCLSLSACLPCLDCSRLASSPPPLASAGWLGWR